VVGLDAFRPVGVCRRIRAEEERRAARLERNRRYHLLRKSGLWVRKNRVFSERIARSAGIEVTEGLVIGAMYKRGEEVEVEG